MVLSKSNFLDIYSFLFHFIYKVSKDDRCKVMLDSLQDCLHGIEEKSFGAPGNRESGRSRDSDRKKRRDRSRDRSRSRFVIYDFVNLSLLRPVCLNLNFEIKFKFKFKIAVCVNF